MKVPNQKKRVPAGITTTKSKKNRSRTCTNLLFFVLSFALFGLITISACENIW